MSYEKLDNIFEQQLQRLCRQQIGLYQIEVGLPLAQIARNTIIPAKYHLNILDNKILKTRIQLSKLEKSRLNTHAQIDFFFQQQVNAKLPLPFINESIDIFVLSFFIEFYHDAQKLLKEIYRTLVPGGRVIIIGVNRPKWKLLTLNNKIKNDKIYYSPSKIINFSENLNYEILCFDTEFYNEKQFPDFKKKLLKRIFPNSGYYYLLELRKTMASIKPISFEFKKNFVFEEPRLTSTSSGI